MIKETITYSDYDGNEIIEDFWFHLSQAELLDIEVHCGGLDETLKRINKTKNAAEMYDLFKDIIVKAYGVRAQDNRRMIKTPEVKSEFVDSEAMSALIMKFMNDTDSAAKFINGLVNKSDKPMIAAVNTNK